MNNKKVYIASSFGNKDLLKPICYRLIQEGFEVTSSWIFKETNDLLPKDGNAMFAYMRFWAIQDFEDLKRANLLILDDTPPDNGYISGGGKYMELGMALGRGMQVMVIGAQNCIFMHLPHIIHLGDWDYFFTYCWQRRG